MEFEIAVGNWRDEVGGLRRVHYYLQVETVDTGGFCCENYGVRVSEEDGDSAQVSGITTSALRIDELISLPVSYTHLDVYKRQPLRSATPWPPSIIPPTSSASRPASP